MPASLKLSKSAHAILKNFAKISNSLLLEPGTRQSTTATGRTVLAVAELPEAWPQQTGIYDLTTFLSTLSLFTEPEITFGDDAFTIFSGKSRIKYRYSNPTTIEAQPNKVLKTENPDVTFTLEQAALEQLTKTINILELKAVKISVEAGDVIVRALDPKNSAANVFEYTVPENLVTLHNPKTKVSAIYEQEHIGFLMNGSYTVQLGDWPYAFFKHNTEPVSYYVVAQD